MVMICLWIFGGMEEEDTFNYEFAYYEQKIYS